MAFCLFFNKIHFLMYTTLLVGNIWTGWGYILVIWMNIYFTLISGIQSTHCDVVIMKLKLPVTMSWVLSCHLLSEERTKLLENFKNLDNTLLSHRDDEILQILLYGSHKFSSSVNNKIFLLAIEFPESTKIFWQTLFWVTFLLFANHPFII